VCQFLPDSKLLRILENSRWRSAPRGIVPPLPLKNHAHGAQRREYRFTAA
jgi:hypothetical protein